MKTEENFETGKSYVVVSYVYKKKKESGTIIIHKNNNTLKVTDNRQFSETMKPFLSDKIATATQITIKNDNNKVIANSFELSEEFVIFFEKVVQSIDIKSTDYR